MTTPTPQLNIARAEDLPYATSKPIQFLYESKALLLMGGYAWNDAPTRFTPDRPIINNAMYYFRSITLACDIAEFDYLSSVTSNLQFNTYLQSDSKAVMFREPIRMAKYFDQFVYRLFWFPGQGDDVIFAGFTGTVFQSPSLIGKTSITAKAIISAQEIIDEEYISAFKQKYPKTSSVQGAQL